MFPNSASYDYILPVFMWSADVKGGGISSVGLGAGATGIAN